MQPKLEFADAHLALVQPTEQGRVGMGVVKLVGGKAETHGWCSVTTSARSVALPRYAALHRSSTVGAHPVRDCPDLGANGVAHRVRSHKGSLRGQACAKTGASTACNMRTIEAAASRPS
ncbi:hypothetical protein GCM10027021_28410 [Dyella kyungheensis]